MSARAATLYVRRGTAYVVSMSKTTDGFWVEAGPVLTFEHDDIAAIADGVRAALAASSVDVDTPSLDQLGSQLPEVAGAKSFAAFMRERFRSTSPAKTLRSP